MLRSDPSVLTQIPGPDDSEDASLPADDVPNDSGSAYFRAIKIRRGQGKFRSGLLKLYDFKCAITSEGPKDVLEAAHIEPHAISGRNSFDNGLLLRADLHTLFDIGLIAVDPLNLIVMTHPSLQGTNYESLAGSLIRERVDGSTPSRDLLQNKLDQFPGRTWIGV